MINKFGGSCGACRTWVEAGAGQAIRVGTRWSTYHPGCAPVRTAPPRGTHTGWHDLPLVGFDLEATVPQPMRTRIVSAALTYADGTQDTWLIDPGVPIPPDATALHGITDDMVRANGRPAHEALAEIGTAVAKLVADTTPLVAFCAPYDVTALHSELARHGLPSIAWDRAVIVDPSVLHREVERYWSGGRQLGDLCPYYEVEPGTAHEAASDARAAVDLARSIAARHERIARMSLPDLHRAQIHWYAEQGRDLQRYFDRTGQHRTVGLDWPLETQDRDH
ncbi:3'-5' exonuclease [Micromonospora sagamiensis]|uniref:DNA polymerase-3 subunit epsilon n=1 Tax=Micromonospora sagamiensis TaxID=47875 RepID=A0A562WCU8_9ACTN|nr:DNA polymerase-3 subunit epsilon [Micromonospora sagamiensis]BCL13011.1 3'-5' exonuclease [Micromonospora sagamiensis]